MRIGDILRSKGSEVATVTQTTTVTGLLAEMAARNVGAMVVVGPDGVVVGIVSERDIVRHLNSDGPELLRMPVTDIMSSVVISCGPGDAVDDLAAMMTHNRIRHVPVLDNGRLAGIVSIGDVVKNRLEELQSESQQLQAYILQSG